MFMQKVDNIQVLIVFKRYMFIVTALALFFFIIYGVLRLLPGPMTTDQTHVANCALSFSKILVGAIVGPPFTKALGG